jgi:small multidrug resistance pump
MHRRVPDPHRTTTPVLSGWGALWSAIALNVSQVFLLDSTEGLREPALLPVAAAGFLAELWLFGRAVRCLSPVIAYAVYGTTPAVVTILSIAFFGEPLTLPNLAGVAIITAGVILLATDRIPTPRASSAEDITPPRRNASEGFDTSQSSPMVAR